MKNVIRLLVALSITAISASAIAYTFGSSTVIGGFRWVASGFLPASDCTVLKLDITGDFTNSRQVSVYGTLNCGTRGSYAISGSGYFDVSNSLNMIVSVGILNVWQCVIAGASTAGSCTTYLSSTGTQTGTVSLTPN